MHEMGIAMQIARIATEAIPDADLNTPVERVNIRVGRLTAVVPDSLRFWFEMAVKDTPLSGAELAIEVVPITGKCPACGAECTVTGLNFACPKCNDTALDIISGQELEVKSIEIADPET